ncbi:hypothetical protein CYY_004046 [Polysphondylium violaceum]|uniref:DNA repair nuclease/redox regulator APEX1 n=1 Tax=Polysphondylium violaceum TaxID=133409 RepID=A0A8J4Q628_9MYCE|nr:hypothetical protein CYY_004046 [Polysphondylium violaceum]
MARTKQTARKVPISRMSKNTNTLKIAKTPSPAKPKRDNSDTESEGEDQVTTTTTIGSSADSTEFADIVVGPGQMKIISWNVAGFNAVVGKGFREYVEKEQPDILCLQETKMAPAKVPKSAIPDGYEYHFIAANRPGLHGTALLTKTKPLSLKFGIGIEKHDNEGRVITAEYPNFYVVNTYVPNAGTQGLQRLDYRIKEWDKDFHAYLNNLKATKPVIWCGDLNVAHHEIDLKNPKTNKRSAGFTVEERTSFGDFLSQGWIDSYRHFNPDKTGAYTFWSYKSKARETNAGWRLDYFIVPNEFINSIKTTFIRSKVLGSDHCPIGIVVDA